MRSPALTLRPAQPQRLRPGAKRRERLEPGHGNALPHLAGLELAHDRAGASDVVGIAVREDQIVEPPHPGHAQRRSDDAVADVETGAPGRPGHAAGVNEQRGAARKAHESRVALPDVEKRDVKPAVAASGHERPRLRQHPQRGGRRRRDSDTRA